MAKVATAAIHPASVFRTTNVNKWCKHMLWLHVDIFSTVQKASIREYSIVVYKGTSLLQTKNRKLWTQAPKSRVGGRLLDHCFIAFLPCTHTMLSSLHPFAHLSHGLTSCSQVRTLHIDEAITQCKLVPHKAAKFVVEVRMGEGAL